MDTNPEPRESKMLEEVRRWRREAYEEHLRRTPEERAAHDNQIIREFGLQLAKNSGMVVAHSAPESIEKECHSVIDKVNFSQKFSLIQEHWSPKIAGEVNGFLVKLVKFQGEFVWHHHEVEDEMFLVVKGSFVMKLRDGDVNINEGEFIIIPHGVEHKPVAERECHVVLFEPNSTLNTGNVKNERTLPNLDRV